MGRLCEQSSASFLHMGFIFLVTKLSGIERGCHSTSGHRHGVAFVFAGEGSNEYSCTFSNLYYSQNPRAYYEDSQRMNTSYCTNLQAIQYVMLANLTPDY